MSDPDRLQRMLRDWDPEARQPAWNEERRRWLRSRVMATAREAASVGVPSVPGLRRGTLAAALLLTVLLGGTSVRVLVERGVASDRDRSASRRMPTLVVERPERRSAAASETMVEAVVLPESWQPPRWREARSRPAATADGGSVTVAPDPAPARSADPPPRRRLELVAAGGTRLIWSIEARSAVSDNDDREAARLR